MTANRSMLSASATAEASAAADAMPVWAGVDPP